MRWIKKIWTGNWGILIFLMFLCCLNSFLTTNHTGFDFTAEKRFTLSASTIRLLKKIDKPVLVTVYLSGDLKSEFKKLSASTRDLLDNFKSYAGNNFNYRFEVPGEKLEDSIKMFAGDTIKVAELVEKKSALFDSLVMMGIRPTTQKAQSKAGEASSQRQIFPGAIIEYEGNFLAVDLLQGQVQKTVFNSGDLLDRETLNSAEALLEFKFANVLQQLTREKVPVVGYVYGNGELPYGHPLINDLSQSLYSQYYIDTVNLSTIPAIDPKVYQALVIVKPTDAFSDEDKLKLDQYVMHGGNLMLLVDMIYAERDSLQNGMMFAYSRELGLNDWLIQYGARIREDLIADQHCDVIPVQVGNLGDKPQTRLLPWTFFPLLQAGSDHPLVKNQADVLSSFANSIDTATDLPEIRKTILLKTSDYSAQRPTPTLVDINMLKQKEDLRAYNKKGIPVSVLLEGKFKSVFTSRASVAQKASLGAAGMEFLNQRADAGKIILVSDADIVVNAVSESYGPLPMGTNNYTKVGFANHDFFMNCVDYISNQDNVLESRAKDYTLRLLDLKKVEKSKGFWQLINILLPVFVILLFAIVLQWNRKRKFAY